jgi:MFS family permease
VALPLVALDAGYSTAMVGVLTAVSAIGQMTTRLFLAAAMRRFSDWLLVLLAGFLLLVSCLLLVFSTELVPFVLVQVLQGAARACFWTGSQTHVVRGDGAATAPLAVLGFAGGIGMTAGPLLGGVLADRSLVLALLAAAAAALAGLAPTLLLDRHPPFAPAPQGPRRRAWRRPGVDLGCWAGLGSGGWRGLLNSYVPVALVAAGLSSTRIGLLISAANVASMVGTVLVARVRGRAVHVSYVVSTVATGAGIGLCAFVADSFPLVTAALVISGLGAGALQTLGPGVAAEAVPREERGDAITAVGTFRAVAMFASPLGVGGLVSLVPLGPAMAVLGALMTVPAVTARFRPEAPRPPDEDA